MNFFEKYKNKKQFEYGDSGVQYNKNFTIEWVKRNMECPWNRSNVSSRKVVTFDDLEENIDFFSESFKDVYGVICNPNLTIEKFMEYKEIPRVRYPLTFLSSNSGIKMKNIEDHPEIEWNFEYISENPSITIEFIEKNIDKIHFKELSKNRFTFENYRQQRILERTKSFIILSHLNNVLTDILWKIVNEYF